MLGTVLAHGLHAPRAGLMGDRPLSTHLGNPLDQIQSLAQGRAGSNLAFGTIELSSTCSRFSGVSRGAGLASRSKPKECGIPLPSPSALSHIKYTLLGIMTIEA